ncbi:hypothetical protein GCM10020000_80680 [Streptomyces olivoverticillatus]
MADADDGVIVWLPLIDGAERLGVLAVRTASLDGVRLRRSRMLAYLFAMLITSKRAYSDWLAARTRIATMRLPTEMLRAFLPSHTIGSSRCVSTAVLEPAYDVAGDAFDHSVVKDILHTMILDSMGHDLTSGLTTSVAMAAARNARRGGGDLADVVGSIDQALAQWLPDHFCTGVLCLARRAHRGAALGQLRSPAAAADPCRAGARRGAGQPPRSHRSAWPTNSRWRPGRSTRRHWNQATASCSTPTVSWKPATRTGRSSASTGSPTSSSAPPPLGQRPAEVLRLLIHAILDYQRNELRDDTTILLFEWRPQYQ